MKPVKHALVSAVVALACFVFTDSWTFSILAFLPGVVIDIDHLFDCFKSGNKLNLRELLSSSYFRESGKMYIILHSYEFLFLLFTIAFAFGGLQLGIWVSLSFILHLISDQLSYRTHPLAYFITFRATKNFSLQILCSEKRPFRRQP
jgi:hypothetical protein